MQDSFGFSDSGNNTSYENDMNGAEVDGSEMYRSYMNMIIMYSRNFMFFAFWFFIVIGYLFMVMAAAYIAWNSVSFDPIWVKMLKTYLSAVFAPFYLFYVFMKNILIGSGISQSMAPQAMGVM